ncbi:MAG: family 78 glycoside hydrolase catalytic domain, partial [Mobilitalea sp.]
YEPIEMKELEPGNRLIDFGQNLSGLFEIEVEGKTGEIIDIYPAEKIDADGRIDQKAKGWVEIATYQTYILRGNGVECWKPKFAYSSGRYLGIKGASLDEKQTKFPVLHIGRAHFITSASKDIGTFTCDDERYLQIYDLVLKAIESNLNSVHTDCPGVERLAWQEINHLMAPSIMYTKDVRQLWNKIFDDIRVEQYTKEDYVNGADGTHIYFGEGFVSSQAPCYEKMASSVPGIGSFFDVISWGSTIILGVYWDYLFYGDKQILRDNYEAGKKYMKYMSTKVNKDGFINHGLGDWGNPEKDAFARENIETALYYADLKTLSFFADSLGIEEDKIAYQSEAEIVKANYNDKLLVQQENGVWCYRAFDHKERIYLTQACEAFPLYWGMVPEDKEADIIKSFAQTLEVGFFASGEVGLPYIIQTMKKYGMNQKITEFMLRMEHPSYYRFVLDGETTLPEYWEENSRSHNHDMLGHIIEWYYNGIAGITPLEPGFSKVEIKPYLPDSMDRFDCSYESVQGTIGVNVAILNQHLTITITVPVGIEADIILDNLEHRAAEQQLELKVIMKSA